ncbi:hypothetical protein ACA910_012532 [Epithemia clementina (nom. ined.)]
MLLPLLASPILVFAAPPPLAPLSPPGLRSTMRPPSSAPSYRGNPVVFPLAVAKGTAPVEAAVNPSPATTPLSTSTQIPVLLPNAVAVPPYLSSGSRPPPNPDPFLSPHPHVPYLFPNGNPYRSNPFLPPPFFSLLNPDAPTFPAPISAPIS